jgi:hypothetical protein
VTITFTPVDGERDTELLHRWVTHPRSVFWGMQGASPADVATELSRIADDPHHEALLGLVDGVPQLLVERYDPHHRELVGVPELEPGDVGMHLLVAPTDRPVHGFTGAAMAAVVALCLADAPRVVVEPDVRHHRIAVLNRAAGFRVLREVRLGDKTAALSVCTRADFAASRLGRSVTRPGPDRIAPGGAR